MNSEAHSGQVQAAVRGSGELRFTNRNHAI
jgi:hypothetical protein